MACYIPLNPRRVFPKAPTRHGGPVDRSDVVALQPCETETRQEQCIVDVCFDAVLYDDVTVPIDAEELRRLVREAFEDAGSPDDGLEWCGRG